jgi:ribosomal protein S18 acetylase RimI-like enzyme
MQKGDKPSLMALVRATPEFKPAEVSVAEEVIDSYLRDPKSSGYSVLVSGDSAVNGYICYGPTPLTEGTWDIYWLAVAAGEQGKGVGSALLSYAEARIKAGGGRLVIIETSSQAGYERTRRFYLKHAYETIAQITDFYAPGDDKIILQKRVV